MSEPIGETPPTEWKEEALTPEEVAALRREAAGTPASRDETIGQAPWKEEALTPDEVAALRREAAGTPASQQEAIEAAAIRPEVPPRDRASRDIGPFYADQAAEAARRELKQ